MGGFKKIICDINYMLLMGGFKKKNIIIGGQFQGPIWTHQGTIAGARAAIASGWEAGS
jgi:hypothetical protein